MPKKDFSQVAFDVVQRANGQGPKPAPSPKKKAAPQSPKNAAKKQVKSLIRFSLPADPMALRSAKLLDK